MRSVNKIILTIILLFSTISLSTAYAAACPDIQAAINDLKMINSVQSPQALTLGYLYKATNSVNSDEINFYTLYKPTQVDPETQMKTLAPALTVPTQLPSASASNDELSCIYLGAMLDASTPDFTAPWNQVLVIKTSGTVPPIPPTGLVDVIVNTGDLATGETSFPIKLVNTDGVHTYSKTITSGTRVSFGTVVPGTYIVTVPSYFELASGLYVLDAGEQFDFIVPDNVQQTTLSLNYKKEPAGSTLALVTIGNDGSLPTKYLSFESTVTFTNTSTSETVTKKITLEAGVAVDVPVVLSSGVYTVNLTPPNSSYDVLTLTKTVTVSALEDVPVNFDYKYHGTYRYLTDAQYNELVSTRDQRIDLGQGEMAYHCTFNVGSTVPVDKDCQDHDNFTFPTAQVSFNSTTIAEDKLWAMSLAQASMLERTELNYGRPNMTGTAPFYANVYVVGKDPNTQTLGDYLNYNMGPNYFIARCLQEGNTDCLINGDPVDDCTKGGIGSGSFQLDSWPIMMSAYQGYPMPFKVVKYGYCTRSKSKKGPLANLPGSTSYQYDNFVGGALASAWYDTTSYLDLGTDAGQKNGTALQAIVGEIGETLITESLSSVLYNAGYSSLANGIMVGNRANCIQKYLNPSSVPGDIRWDVNCFTTASAPTSPAAWYALQLPYYDHSELQVPTRAGGAVYKATLSWDDINFYLDLIGPLGYGYYDNYDMISAKAAAKAEFDTLAGSGSTIDFQTQFSNILNAFMQKLPVYIAQVDIPDPTPASLSLRVTGSISFHVQIQNAGGAQTIDPFSPGAEYDFHTTDTILTLLAETPAYVNCGDTFITNLNQEIKKGSGNTYALGFTNQQCTLTKVS